MGISLTRSNNFILNKNTSNTTGNSSVHKNDIVEEILPANIGLLIPIKTNNGTVSGNSIYTTDVANKCEAIKVNGSSNIDVMNITY